MLSLRRLSCVISAPAIGSTSRFYASGPDVKKRLKAVINNMDQYKKYADEYEKKLKSRVDPTNKDFQLRKLLKAKIEEYLRSNPRAIVGMKPQFVLRHPLVYKALGVNSGDLDREKAILGKVKGFLKADDISRSIILVRLLPNGKLRTIGMNTVLHHLASAGRLSLAKKVKAAFRKWGVDENDYTHTSLLVYNGTRRADSSRSAEDAPEHLIDEFNDTFDRTLEKMDPKNIIGQQVVINDYLKKMVPYSTITELQAFLDKVSTKDVATYTILFNGLTRSQQEPTVVLEFLRNMNSSVTQELGNALDYLYYRAYAIALSSISAKLNDQSLVVSANEEALDALKKGFDLGRFLSKEHASPDSKYLNPVGPLEFDLLLKGLLVTGQIDLLIKAFDKCFNHPESSPVPLEGNHVDTYVQALMRKDSMDLARIDSVVQKVYIDRTVWQPRGATVIPTARLTGNIIAALTGTEAESINFSYLRQIIEGHRSLRKTDLIFVEILSPYVKALCRVYMDTDYGKLYGTGRNEKEPVDYVYSFRLLQNGLKTLLFNLEKGHSRDMCIETLGDMKRLADYIVDKYGAPYNAADYKFYRDNLKTLVRDSQKGEASLLESAKNIALRISQQDGYRRALGKRAKTV